MADFSGMLYDIEFNCLKMQRLLFSALGNKHVKSAIFQLKGLLTIEGFVWVSKLANKKFTFSPAYLSLFSDQTLVTVNL